VRSAVSRGVGRIGLRGLKLDPLPRNAKPDAKIVKHAIRK